jgi:hypothetical protein
MYRRFCLVVTVISPSNSTEHGDCACSKDLVHIAKYRHSDGPGAYHFCAPESSPRGRLRTQHENLDAKKAVTAWILDILLDIFHDIRTNTRGAHSTPAGNARLTSFWPCCLLHKSLRQSLLRTPKPNAGRSSAPMKTHFSRPWWRPTANTDGTLSRRPCPGEPFASAVSGGSIISRAQGRPLPGLPTKRACSRINLRGWGRDGQSCPGSFRGEPTFRSRRTGWRGLHCLPPDPVGRGSRYWCHQKGLVGCPSGSAGLIRRGMPQSRVRGRFAGSRCGRHQRTLMEWPKSSGLRPVGCI